MYTPVPPDRGQERRIQRWPGITGVERKENGTALAFLKISAHILNQGETNSNVLLRACKLYQKIKIKKTRKSCAALPLC